ncbi:transcriptional regulator, MucR family [Methylobacterium sp. 4-46]|uniref:MucR family transcriptional regulator n=1 Tax=unclassified Methylobacterium TaxID=2615210 RepID=UPI000152C0BB|nr:MULTISPECIES: MucR family transcriptional regulator [Methylobacterium]ACA19273.1 transcriptional regulator, MucR family [Methylobacterium sp. 4-46]WFT78478.1 MucR family transcriptional regulator [Methylobacterium nodulans]
MTSDPSADQAGLVNLAADIVSAYVANNSVPLGDLGGLIVSVHKSLATIVSPPPPEPAKPVPPIPIRKTVTPDAIISLEDGKPYKSLKRHLSGRGLTPEQYREKWGLPPDYPMVAATYAAQRSELAKSLGLGQLRRERAARKPEPAQPPRKRGRPRKAT